MEVERGGLDVNEGEHGVNGTAEQYKGFRVHNSGADALEANDLVVDFAAGLHRHATCSWREKESWTS